MLEFRAQADKRMIELNAAASARHAQVQRDVSRMLSRPTIAKMLLQQLKSKMLLQQQLCTPSVALTRLKDMDTFETMVLMFSAVEAIFAGQKKRASEKRVIIGDGIDRKSMREVISDLATSAEFLDWTPSELFPRFQGKLMDLGCDPKPTFNSKGDRLKSIDFEYFKTAANDPTERHITLKRFALIVQEERKTSHKPG